MAQIAFHGVFIPSPDARVRGAQKIRPDKGKDSPTPGSFGGQQRPERLGLLLAGRLVMQAFAGA